MTENAKATSNTDRLLGMIRGGQPMTIRQQAYLAVSLSIPAILSQISAILMEYIDASMVGHLGADEAASIGITAPAVWMFTGLCVTLATGFGVQVAHHIGASNHIGARNILRQAIVICSAFGCLMSAIGLIISPHLPYWLGGDESIASDASTYFSIYSLALIILQMGYLASNMLRCAGNMKVPTICNIVMCILDVIFNFFLIFPTREAVILGVNVTIPGAGMGVEGAGWGTFLAALVSGLLLIWFMLYRSRDLHIMGERGSFRPTRRCLFRAFTISSPLALERIVMCGAQLVITAIVAPLGSVAIAAHSFAITVEGLCYMPGYGISEAATTLVGQSAGSGRSELTRRFAYITLAMGMFIMAIMGVVMYIGAPTMFGLMTENRDIVELGTRIIRIEAFAEPMFAASIVVYGIFVGLGRTIIPTTINFTSIWVIRITLAFFLVPSYGLVGVWIAMCVELCARGIMFLLLFRTMKSHPVTSLTT